MTFKELHHQEKPLLICNVWDVPSAKAAEKLGFRAIATSSSAIAAVLGYQDGEELSFEELAYVVKRIAQNTELPFSVDLEGGYSRDPKGIADHIAHLHALGVVGINIEDSLISDKRSLLPAEDFTHTLKAVKKLIVANQTDLFINVRTDPFLLGLSNALEETQKRIHLYEQTGVEGIFVPCITQESDIKAVVSHTQLPVNVMCMPELPDFSTLQSLGVKRISMGNFLLGKLYQGHEQNLQDLLDQNSFTSIFD